MHKEYIRVTPWSSCPLGMRDWKSYGDNFCCSIVFLLIIAYCCPVFKGVFSDIGSSFAVALAQSGTPIHFMENLTMVKATSLESGSVKDWEFCMY